VPAADFPFPGALLSLRTEDGIMPHARLRRDLSLLISYGRQVSAPQLRSREVSLGPPTTAFADLHVPLCYRRGLFFWGGVVFLGFLFVGVAGDGFFFPPLTFFFLLLRLLMEGSAPSDPVSHALLLVLCILFTVWGRRGVHRPWVACF